MKYIYSNLTGGLPVEGLDTQAGQSFAVDLVHIMKVKNLN